LSISVPDQKALWGSAAKRCSFRDPVSAQCCRRELVANATLVDKAVVLGENAHIEGEKLGAARYREEMTDEERNCYNNLILLCSEHHTLVDHQPNTYTVVSLKAMKEAHEEWVRKTLRPIEYKNTAPDCYITEEVFSSLLPVIKIPKFVFAAPCQYKSEREAKKAVGPHFMPVFIIKDRLYSFYNLKNQPDYLTEILDLAKMEPIAVADMERDPAYALYLKELLNRVLNKIAGHRGLELDKDHHRYFFPQKTPGKPVEVSYKSVAGMKVSRSAVWNPITKSTKKPKRYWVHLAVGLKFHSIGESRWVLSIRPEFHYTHDGQRPLQGKQVGPRSTRAKSRMWNYDLLQEVQFWRDYLGESQPRIIFPMDKQAIIISCRLLSSSIRWPGIPNDIKTYRTADIEDDLFSVADLQSVLAAEQDLGFDDFHFEEPVIDE
jgi:hypothetical protein